MTPLHNAEGRSLVGAGSRPQRRKTTVHYQDALTRRAVAEGIALDCGWENAAEMREQIRAVRRRLEGKA